MNGRIKLSGPLKSYLNWPITLSVLMIIMNIAVYFINVRAGTLVSFFVAAYIAIVVILYFHNRPIILNELITFATQYGQIQKNLMRDFAIPFAVLDADGKVMWLNKSFSKLTGKDKKYHKSITNVMSEITQDILPGEEDEIKEVEISYGSQNFRVKAAAHQY